MKPLALDKEIDRYFHNKIAVRFNTFKLRKDLGTGVLNLGLISKTKRHWNKELLHLISSAKPIEE